MVLGKVRFFLSSGYTKVHRSTQGFSGCTCIKLLLRGLKAPSDSNAVDRGAVRTR